MCGLRRWMLGFALIGFMLTVAGCSPLISDLIGQGEVLIFYIVNQTGQEIKVQVLADGKRLFTVKLEAKVEGSGQVPPPMGYPAKEVKARVNPLPRVLEIRELISGRVRVFDITGLDSKRGFRIVVTAEGIELSRDYLPIR